MRKPDRNDQIRGEIKKGMTIYGYGRSEMAVFLRCSESTFSRRLKCPEDFTVRDLRIMGEKLHLDLTAFM